MNEALPIHRHRQQIVETVRNHPVVVVEGPTGSGKTTQLPQILWEAELGGRIGVTQPRRIAAVSVARRIAFEAGVSLGAEVGYAIRFDDLTSPETVVKIMTDGILLQEARSDADFSDYGVLIIDEAHERSLNIDLCLGLLHRVLTRRPDVRVIVSSATLKPSEFQAFFSSVAGRVPLVSIAGRAHPIEIRHRPHGWSRSADMPEAVAQEVLRLHRDEGAGHVLAFLSGQGMIERTALAIERERHSKARGGGDMVVLPLYARLTREEQEQVFDEVSPGQRKVILATNIAETSITIEDVRFVVDCGLAKLPRYDTRTGVSTLSEEPISRASAEQRAGRAGRTAPGVVVRLYDKADLARQPDFTDEEIRRLDLTEIVLRLLDLEIREVETFPFPTRPPKTKLRAAVRALRTMGAIDQERALTRIGRRMVPFPLAPPLARAVVEAAERFPDVVDEVLLVGAALSARSPFLYPFGEEAEARAAQRGLAHPSGDSITAVRTVRAYAKARDAEAFCRRNYLDPDIMKFIVKAHGQLAEIAREQGIEVRGGGDPGDVIRSVAAGYAENVLLGKGRGRAYVSFSGVQMGVHPSSVLFGTRHYLILAAELVRSTRTYARHCSVLRPEWLGEIHPEAAAKWRVRGKKGDKRGRGPRNKGAAEAPTEVRVADVNLPVRRVRGKPRLDIPLSDVPRLIAAGPSAVPPEYARWPARIVTSQGSFGTGQALRELVAQAAVMPLPAEGERLEREPLEGAILEAETHWDTIRRHLDRVMAPTLPAKGRKPGWLALVATGLGEYWFEVVTDFWGALQTNALSLESLAAEVSGEEERKARVERVLEEVRGRLDGVQSRRRG